MYMYIFWKLQWNAATITVSFSYIAAESGCVHLYCWRTK